MIATLKPWANVYIQVLDAKSKRLIKAIKGHNLVVLNGRNLTRDLLGGDFNRDPNIIAVGTDNTAVTDGDTALGTEVFRNLITARIQGSSKITYQLFISDTQANGNTLVEAGLINERNGADTLFARIVFAPIVKTGAVTVTITWEVNLTSVS